MLCDRLTCMNGVCVNVSNVMVCKCKDGYYGRFCEFEMNECSSNPCRNGGSCIDKIASFLCQCKPGYTGITCQQMMYLSGSKLRMTAHGDGHVGVAVAMLALLFMAVLTAATYWCSRKRRTKILRSLLTEEMKRRLRNSKDSTSALKVYLALSEDEIQFRSPFFSPLTSDQRRDIAIQNILESPSESTSETKESTAPKG
ncbi:EGF domain containing protein [Trichuris trichiura]|uniref:EGF domain containing protein n=1 Tax=Trichuris trichiura TaxID=36087 RepID=A0A077Z3C9_TRITR|nr:EGF domain containing protein [Trichuris trichiura]